MLKISEQMERNYPDIQKKLLAFTDAGRAEILYQIMLHKEGIRVSDIKTKTRLSRPAVSHHVKILLNAKMIQYRRVGTKNYYYPAVGKKDLEDIIRFFEDGITLLKDYDESK